MSALTITSPQASYDFTANTLEWKMQRTDTTKHRVFQPAGRDGPNFDFSVRDNIRTTVPKESNWHPGAHWHSNESSCISIKSFQGGLKVFDGGGSYGSYGSGLQYSVRWQGHHSWSANGQEEDLIVILTANEILYRN